MISPICCICGSKLRTSNSVMIFAVLFIWSMASSIEVIEILNIGAIERRDEGAAHRGQHLAGDFVGFGFALEDLLAIMLDVVAALQQAAQRLGAGDDNRGVPLEEIEETLFLGHQRLKPAEHRNLMFCGCAARIGRRRVCQT